MLLRLAGKVVWGTTKFTVKHVVVPIAITAATAIVLDELSKKMRDGAPKAPKASKAKASTGIEPMIRPER